MQEPQFNPFAPPTIETERKTTDCVRKGKSVIVPVGFDLPQRCIICNSAAQTPVKSKKLYWHSPWLYLLIPLNILIYLVVGLLARKSFVVSPGLCEAHASRRKRRVGVAMAIALVALCLGVGLLARGQQLPGIGMLSWGLVSLIVAMFLGRKVYPRKITKEYLKLGGCKEPFLASLE
ncbi:hypothetical protein LRH25_19825 [Ideonella azotifigens]|uniref:Uncharacterized protein n=1 Tax=Ideonella azotifigens TaxID=513160 RepID=A0ABN1K005_9BURK|nr:hypothetical protein [Ideonella azotifigens]MCD2342579.1 hypothetical protein [Ideonella azotifigens]